MTNKISCYIFAAALMLCSCFAHGQYYVRWDIGQPGSAGAVTTSGTGLAQLLALPGVSLNFCYSPANAVPCTNFAPTFNATAATASQCPSNTPIVFQGTSTCVGTGDNFGNLGVWTLPGTYAYTLTVNGVSSGPYTISIAGPMATVYAAPGESVTHAAARLPSSGGYVFFATGPFPSSGFVCSTPNVWLQGTGMPDYNSLTAPTALTGGTIIQGTMQGQQGCDHWVVKDLGVDVGPNWVNSANSGTPVDGLVIYNAGQVVGAPPVQSPIFENVAVLGYSTAAPNHSLLMENVTHGLMHHVKSFYNQHGAVLKGTNSTIDDLESAGHATEAALIKSDNYAIASDDTMSNFYLHSLGSPGDTVGLAIDGIAAPIASINIVNGTFENLASHAVYIQGASNTNTATGINFSNLTINYPSAPGGTYGMQFVQYVQDVSVDNAYIANYPIGIGPSSGVSFQTDISLTNSKIVNASTTGAEFYNRGTVTGTTFNNVGTAIVSDNSTVTECSNTFLTVSTRSSGTVSWCGLSSEDVNGNVSFFGGLGPGKAAIGSFNACTSALEGEHLIATNCNAGCSAGGTCTGGGTTHCEMYCNSSPAWVETGR